MILAGASCDQLPLRRLDAAMVLHQVKIRTPGFRHGGRLPIFSAMEKKPPAWLRPAIEYGPLGVFFIAYYKFDLIQATGWFQRGDDLSRWQVLAPSIHDDIEGRVLFISQSHGHDHSLDQGEQSHLFTLAAQLLGHLVRDQATV